MCKEPWRAHTTRCRVPARSGRPPLLTCSLSPTLLCSWRLPGLTKMVSKLSKEGAWRKALEVFEAVEEMG